MSFLVIIFKNPVIFEPFEDAQSVGIAAVRTNHHRQ
jgi:hypothetical protein